MKPASGWQEVADSKYAHDAQHLFEMSKTAMGKKPQILITDGLRSYHEAWLKEFRTNKQADSTVHINHITLKGEHHNNKMERLNGEIREREKGNSRTKENRHTNLDWLPDLSQLHTPT